MANAARNFCWILGKEGIVLRTTRSTVATWCAVATTAWLATARWLVYIKMELFIKPDCQFTVH